MVQLVFMDTNEAISKRSKPPVLLLFVFRIIERNLKVIQKNLTSTYHKHTRYVSGAFLNKY